MPMIVTAGLLMGESGDWQPLHLFANRELQETFAQLALSNVLVAIRCTPYRSYLRFCGSWDKTTRKSK
jgi:hypothetical protein